MRTPDLVRSHAALLYPSSIHSILEHWQSWDWTWQGFGMVRMYLDQDKRYRLNIWDTRSMVPRVSLIHDHPWSFKSTIYAGEIVNRRYLCEELYGDQRIRPHTHWMKRIVTGEDGHDATTNPIPVVLREVGRETYGPGMTYSQRLDEVHETRAQVGTVTVNDRTPPTKEYTARVFWYTKEPHWVGARPRPAAEFEVKRAVVSALELWPS